MKVEKYQTQLTKYIQKVYYFISRSVTYKNKRTKPEDDTFLHALLEHGLLKPVKRLRRKSVRNK